MSADLGNDQYAKNYGITLPDEPEATHNIHLSPFFIGSSGNAHEWIKGGILKVVGGRGKSAAFWSMVAKSSDIRAYYAMITMGSTTPTRNEGAIYGWSLRCLVSTTNS